LKERKNGVVIFYKGKKYTAKEIQALTGYSLSGIYHAYQAGNIDRVFFGRKNRKGKYDT